MILELNIFLTGVKKSDRTIFSVIFPFLERATIDKKDKVVDGLT